MKIDNIRQMVDDVLTKKIHVNELLKLDLESKHYDVPLLSLISAKKHFPSHRADSDFLTLLSIYRKIELEKMANKDKLAEFISFKESYSV